MKGWITWLAAACTAGLGVVSLLTGETETGLQQLVLAGGMIGLGRKIEKHGAPAFTASIAENEGKTGEFWD